MRSCKGFTLAEVMIVLTVIGVLAGILIPVANNARPDEKVMKFKKAHATLAQVIRELVNSDKYYLDGDLGMRPDVNLIDGSHDGDSEYFCKAFAELLSTKIYTCNYGLDKLQTMPSGMDFDKVCKEAPDFRNDVQRIITVDGITYNVISNALFGDHSGYGDCRKEDKRCYLPRELGQMPRFLTIICVDVDGRTSKTNATNCDNECPFGYGIQADGKIYLGTRAKEWLEKGFQKGKNDN